MWRCLTPFAKHPKDGQEKLRRLYQFQVTSSKRTFSVVPNMELPSRMYYKAKEMLQKARRPKHRGDKTILERWHNDDKYHESLSKIGWTEEQIIQYDELALITPILQQEGKEIEMRKVEYSSWIKNVLKDQWINDMISLKQNEKWNDWMMNMWKRLQKEIPPTHPVQPSRQRRHQQFEGLEECNYQVDAQTGWKTCPSKSQGNLSRNPTHSSSSTQREQHDDWQSNKSWNSWRSSSWTEQQWFLSSEMMFFFDCRKANSLAIDGGCRQIHLPHAHIFTCTVIAQKVWVASPK